MALSTQSMFKRLAILATTLVSLMAVAQEDVRVTTAGGGFKITADRLELSMISQIIAATPQWLLHYYSVASPGERVVAEDGKSAELIQTGANEEFKVYEYTAKVEDNSVIVTMDGELLIDEPTDLEYTMFMFPSNILAGASFVATQSDGNIVEGIIPAVNVEDMITIYFDDTVKVDFETQYGKLTVEVLEGMPFLLEDRRYNHFEERYGFRFGDFIRIGKGKQYSKLKLTFDKLDSINIPVITGDGQGTAKLIASDDVVIEPAKQQRELLPTPQEIKRPTVASYYPLPRNATIAIKVEDSEKERLFRASNRVLHEQGGIDIATTEKSTGNVEVFVADKANGLVAPQNEEGYALKVTLNGVTIVSKTPRGCFYGLQTLRNLYVPEMNAFEVCTIVDYPDMEYRGAMFLVDNYSMVAHKYMIENMLAPMKMNEIIMECEFAKWDTTKPMNLHQEGGITKEDLVELIKIANDNYMDVSPLFQTLGHCEWLFWQDQHLDMAEDPAYPYAYNVSHPDLYPLMDSILDEIVEVFNNPKYLHIGHDEVFYFKDAKFPNRPENIEKGAQKIIYDDIMHYYDYAKKHDMRIMMWHDMLVTREENPENGSGSVAPHFTAKIRKKLPKDIIMANWRYYTVYNEYHDVEVFTEEGFDVIGCTWYSYGNIEHLSTAIKENNQFGMMQTIWNGYFGNKEVLQNGFNQIAAYTRSGSWSWNGGYENNDYDSPRLAASFYENMRGLDEVSAGVLLDINAVANLDMSSESNPFIHNDNYDIDKALTPGVNRVGQVEFDIAGKENILYSVATISENHPDAPEKIVIETPGLTAKNLYILHTTIDNMVRRLDAVANLVVTYADGESVTSPIENYRDIGIMEEAYNFNLNPSSAIEFGDKKIWYMSWANPHPEKEIAKIEIVSLGNPYYLFGISASK